MGDWVFFSIILGIAVAALPLYLMHTNFTMKIELHQSLHVLTVLLWLCMQLHALLCCHALFPCRVFHYYVACTQLHSSNHDHMAFVHAGSVRGGVCDTMRENTRVSSVYISRASEAHFVSKAYERTNC